MSTTVGGLTPGATYHYRVVIENSEGTDQGEDGTFTLETPAAGDTCPNAAIRAQQGTSHLPHCRAYEMVSPVDKNGSSVIFSIESSYGVTALSEDGDTATFMSPAPFAGAKSGMFGSYLSERSAAGWTARGISPAVVDAHPFAWGAFELKWLLATPDLTTGIGLTLDRLDPEDTDSNALGIASNDVYQLDADGTATMVSRGNGGVQSTTEGRLGGEGGEDSLSRDGSTVSFSSSSHLVPEDAGRVEGNDLYVRSGGVTELMNQDDEGNLLSPCGSNLGSVAGTGGNASNNAVSEDGSQVAFTVPYTSSAAGSELCGAQRVFVRLRDEGRTLHASASQRDPADPAGVRPARYVGAAADGSKVFFESREMLTDDAPEGGGTYEFRVSDESLHFIVGTGGEVGLPTTIRVSDDGSHVFFRKTVGPGETGAIFVNVEGDVQQIATSTTGDDLRRLAVGGDNLKTHNGRPAYATPDGSALAFLTEGSVTDFDTSGTRQAYLWREGTGGVVCISCDPAGQRPAGSAAGDARLSDEVSTARIVDDAARSVFFSSTARLVAGDVNQASDVYEFTGGRVHLISSGKSRYDSRLVSTSKDGRSVMFATSDPLLEKDVEGGDIDLYVARSEGGFPEAPMTPPPVCQGDSCQPAAAIPAAAPPASEQFAGRPKAKPRKASKRCGKARSGKAKSAKAKSAKSRTSCKKKRKGNR